MGRQAQRWRTREAEHRLFTTHLGADATPAYDILALGASADEETVGKEGRLAAQVAGRDLPKLFPSRLGGLRVEAGSVGPGGPRGVECALCREHLV